MCSDTSKNRIIHTLYDTKFLMLISLQNDTDSNLNKIIPIKCNILNYPFHCTRENNGCTKR